MYHHLVLRVDIFLLILSLLLKHYLNVCIILKTIPLVGLVVSYILIFSLNLLLLNLCSFNLNVICLFLYFFYLSIQHLYFYTYVLFIFCFFKLFWLLFIKSLLFSVYLDYDIILYLFITITKSWNFSSLCAIIYLKLVNYWFRRITNCYQSNCYVYCYWHIFIHGAYGEKYRRAVDILLIDVILYVLLCIYPPSFAEDQK
jgi:hypothetical protein